MIRLTILGRQLSIVLACVVITGCRGLEQAPAPAPAPDRVISTEDRSPPEDAGASNAVQLVAWGASSELPAPGGVSPPALEWTEPAAERADFLRPLPVIISADAAARPLTLDDLQQLASVSNPTLRQAYALVRQARGNWHQVGLYPNPTVEAQQASNNEAFDMFNMFVTQEIVTANKLRLNRAVASYDVQRACWEAEAQNLRVLNDVQIRFFAALAAQRQVAVAEDLVKISEDGVRVSEQLRAGEQVSEADVLQARLQLSQTEIVLRNAQVRAAATWRQLGNVVGWPDLPLAPLAGDLEEAVPELDWDFAWQHLLDANALLRAASARAAAAYNQVLREQKQPIPNLELTSGLGRTYFSPQFMMYTLQLGVTLPTTNRNQGNIAAANGELRAARAEVERLELNLRNELAKTFRSYLSARNQVQNYRDVILPLAEQNLSLSLKRYEEGEFDFLRVLTARRDLFDARIKYVQSLMEQRITVIEIQGLLLTGGLDPVDSHPTASNQAGQTNDSGQ